VDSPDTDISAGFWRAPPDSNGRPADSKFYDLAQDVATLGPHVGQLWANSERYLKAVASRSRLAPKYGEELARQVLDLEVVKLAQEVLAGGEMTYSRATRLAQAILTGAKGRQIAEERDRDAKRELRRAARLGRRG
jgi:hypothetical protein